MQEPALFHNSKLSQGEIALMMSCH